MFSGNNNSHFLDFFTLLQFNCENLLGLLNNLAAGESKNLQLSKSPNEKEKHF